MSHKILKYLVSFLVAFLALVAVFTSMANASTPFSSKDTFAIPDCNSQISFAAGGLYDSATLVSNAWVFGGLSFDAEYVTGFSISAKDCNVTITKCSGINLVNEIGWVTYNVTGVGSQTFGLASLTGDGGFVDRYAVFIDGVNRTEGDGWTYTSGYVPNAPNMPNIPSLYFTVTGATTNVSIGYTAIFNPAPLEPESSQSPNPTPTASPTPSSGSHLQVQVIYTIALVIVVVVILLAVAFVALPRFRSRRLSSWDDGGRGRKS